MVPTPLVLKKKSIKKQKTSDTLIGTDSANNYLLPGPSSVGRVKKRRKIRATEDFNQWNRSSLGSDIKPAIRESLLVQGKKTKKLKEYNYLPKILIDDLQNVSPNIDYARKKSKCKGVKIISTESSVEASSEITSEEEKSDKQNIQKKKRSTREKLSDVISDPDECKKVKTVSTESEITSEEKKSDKKMIRKKKRSKGKKISDGISDPDDPEVVFNVHKRRKRRRGPNHNQAHPVTYSEDDISKSCSSSTYEDDANKNLQNSCNSETQDILKQENISTSSEYLLKQNQTFEERGVAEESQGKRLTRKSVRFVTPEERTEKKRNTFDLESPTTDALKSLSKYNSSTFEKLEDRRCTPHVKKSVEIDARQNISKLKLEYSTDSASEDIDLYAMEPVDNNVTISKLGNTSNIHDGTTPTSNKTTRTRKTPSKDSVQMNETQDSVTRRQATTYEKENAEQNSILHNISRSRASEKASVSKDASTVDKNERKLPSLVHSNSKNNILEHTSMTPNKFGAKNNSLRRNILHKSTLGLLDNTDGRNSHIISTPNKSTPHKKMVDRSLCGSPFKLAATGKKCNNLKRVDGSAITLDQTNEKYVSHISLNDSEKNLLGIALNNSSKNTLRRSNSAPNIQDLNNKSLPSPIVKKSKTPKKPKDSSVINLITPTSAETNQTRNKSTRKRWNKSMGVSFLDSSGNVFNISPPWKGDISDAAVQSESDTSLLLETKQSSVKKIKEPSGSSTPYVSIQKKKKTVVEKSPLKTSDRLSFSLKKSGASISKPSTRKKMPNFALIHQMAFDKMENIQELAERKATRAQQLISGQKPAVTVTQKSPNCRKPLKYSPKIVKKVIPVIKRTKKSPTVQINIKTNVKVITPSKSNPKVISKPVQRKLEQAKLKSSIPKPLPKKLEDEKKQLSKLGFKVQSQLPKSKTRDQEVKAVAARTSILKNTVDTRRNVVQNIRTNRRFELLMKMRNKQ